MAEYTPHQQKIIKRYYDNQDTILRQRLAELVTDLYLAEGKKPERIWKKATETMEKLGVPQDRIDHLIKSAKPELLAELVKELQA